jgi:hypothetical protein
MSLLTVPAKVLLLAKPFSFGRLIWVWVEIPHSCMRLRAARLDRKAYHLFQVRSVIPKGKSTDRPFIPPQGAKHIPQRNTENIPHPCCHKGLKRQKDILQQVGPPIASTNFHAAIVINQ